MKAIHVSTPGLMCSACTSLVERALSGLDGVVSVTATLSDFETSVLFDEKRIDERAVLSKIVEAGFEAELA